MNKTFPGKRLRIAGMHCAHCATTVQKALAAVPGVTQATADLAEQTATVRLERLLHGHTLAAAVAEAGFIVTGFETLTD